MTCSAAATTVLIGGLVADALIGGPGIDTADYSGPARRGVNISLGGAGTSWPDTDGSPDDGAGDDFLVHQEPRQHEVQRTGWPATGQTTTSKPGVGTTGSPAAVPTTRSIGGEGADNLFGDAGDGALLAAMAATASPADPARTR